MNLFRRTQPTPTPTPAPAAGARPVRGAAVSLEKVQQAAPALVSLYKQAGVSLAKHGLAGERAAVYLVLDRSGSMKPYYQARRGQISHMQSFAEQVLGLSANLDDDGAVPTVFFDTAVRSVVEVSLTSYQGQIGDEHDQLGRMGGTDYAAAMHTVIGHYSQSGSEYPALVVFQTDGATRDEDAVKALLRDSSHRLPIFWQFVGFGQPDSPDFAFLRRLDRLKDRAVDNAGFFEAGLDPAALSDAELYDRLTREFSVWLAAARREGIA